MKRVVRFLRSGSGAAAVAQTGLASVLLLGVNVMTGIICARALGAGGRGELAALLLAPQMLSFLFTLGLPMALIVRSRERPERMAELVGAALVASAVMGLLAAAVGYVALPRFLAQYDAEVLRVARALLVFVVFGVPSTVLVAALQLRGEFLAFNRMRWWQGASILAAILALAAAGSLDPMLGALAYLVPALPFVLWNVWWVARGLRPRLDGLGSSVRELVAYGVRAHGVDAVGTLLMQLDKLLLIGILAPAAFGVYVVVFNLSRLITMFAASVVPVLLPRTAGKPLAEVLAVTSRVAGLTSLCTLLAVGGFALLGVPLLLVLYGEDFVSGYPVLLILAAEAALASGASILQQPYLVTNRVGTVALYQTVSLVVAAILMYALAHRFAAAGAAVGLLAASGVRVWLTYRGYRTRFGVSAPSLLPDWHEWTVLVSRLRALR